jgi:hypothetical protein
MFLQLGVLLGLLRTHIDYLCCTSTNEHLRRCNLLALPDDLLLIDQRWYVIGWRWKAVVKGSTMAETNACPLCS